MDTLKTGFVVMLLLAVLYGVYVVLNKDQSPPTAEIAWHQQQAEQELQIDIGSPTDAATAASGGNSGSGPSGLSASGINAPLNNAATLGIPSVVKAELTPIPEEPAALEVVPKPSVTPPVASAPASSLPLPNPSTPVASESPASPTIPNSPLRPLSSPLPGTAEPLTPPVPAPSFTKSGDTAVAAPTLLSTTNPPAAGPPSPDAKPETPSGAAPSRTGGLSSLPALRDAPAAWPTPEATAAPPLRPAIKVPERTTETKPEDEKSADQNLASTTGSSYLPAGGPAAAEVAPSAAGASPVPDDLTPAAQPEGTDSTAKSVTTAAALDVAMREAQSNLAQEQWYQALFILSKFYDSPDLNSQQRQDLLDLLDPLAAKVVYSSEHLVTDAHEVSRGETLAQIAASHQVPPELIANINGIENPDLLIPGTKLKMVRGPFRAEIDLTRKELTLFAGQLYAGRFPISVGQDPEPKPGDYRVIEKQPGRDYYAATGQKMSAEDPQNPFGRAWIGLDKELSIHGSPDRGEAGGMGCISLSPLDANDVYSILSQGSSVTIR